MSKAVEKKIDSKGLIETARKHFGQMQKSWFYFAQSISLIKETESFKSSDATFKEFCAREYPTVSFATIGKFIAIVESWGEAIESRMKKDSDYRLPAYESFYQLVTVEDKVPKEELSKLRKSVLDSKTSYATLREKLKIYLRTYRKKVSEEVEKSVDELERQLVRDIREDVDDVAEFDDLDGEEDDFLDRAVEDAEEKADKLDSATASTSPITSRIGFIRDELPEITKKLKTKKLKVTDAIVGLAKDLEDLVEVVDKFLAVVEDRS